MKAKSEKSMPLSTLQAELEAATKEMKLSQSAFKKASERLSIAEERHSRALITLNREVAVLKALCKVTSIEAS
jgi:hypothetical protein